MDESGVPTLTRRHALTTLAVGALAGCTSDDGTDGTPTAATDAGVPGETCGPGAATSLAGSCGSVFGDTDERYDGPVAAATFAYPMGGSIDYADDGDTGSVLAVGYPGGGDEFDAVLTVAQRGPYSGDPDRGATALRDAEYEDGGTVSYDGSERTVAVLRYDGGEIRLFGVRGPDGVYELEAKATVADGDPCPTAYANVTERVTRSFRPA
jgi:hypothetical protein